MKLYHGVTRTEFLNSILKRGIVPRGQKPGNWETAPSRSDCVYLTDAYAPYFGPLIVEIDVERLELKKLLPDEDAVEQTMRGKDGIEGTLEERAAIIRNQLHLYKDGQWEDSLKVLGTCAYRGKIHPSAISRIAVLPVKTQMFWDPVMVLLNYAICGHRYRMQMKRIFGDYIEITDNERDDWQIPMVGHDVHQITGGMIVKTTHISAPDERIWARKEFQDAMKAGQEALTDD